MIEVLATGALSTIQDMGRFGYRRFGVGTAGAMDTLAVRVGNAMLMNANDAAFVEVVIFPFRVRFHADTTIALTGADAQARLDGVSVGPWWSVPVLAGQELEMRRPLHGGVAYLCVAGGIDVPKVMGSRSTDLKARFGGFQGRPLRRGDRFGFPASHSNATRRAGRTFGMLHPDAALAEKAAGCLNQDNHSRVRVVAGSEWDEFSAETQELFLSSRWKVSLMSNRQGARLEGPELKPRKNIELLSHGIVPGVVQVPPSGQPIVMKCDAQTSGGYPIIASVIEADQWRVAQTKLGGELELALVTLEEATEAWRVQCRYVQDVVNAVSLGILRERDEDRHQL